MTIYTQLQKAPKFGSDPTNEAITNQTNDAAAASGTGKKDEK